MKKCLGKKGEARWEKKHSRSFVVSQCDSFLTRSGGKKGGKNCPTDHLESRPTKERRRAESPASIPRFSFEGRGPPRKGKNATPALALDMNKNKSHDFSRQQAFGMHDVQHHSYATYMNLTISQRTKARIRTLDHLKICSCPGQQEKEKERGRKKEGKSICNADNNRR